MVTSPEGSFSTGDNFITSIKEWWVQQKEMLICIDANNNPQKPSTKGIFRIFNKTSLIDLHTS